MNEIKVTIKETDSLIVEVKEVEIVDKTQNKPEEPCAIYDVPDLLQIYNIAKA